jgi:ABC-2 type transport system permease protein
MARGENQGMAVTQLFVLGGAAVSGLWVPFNFLPSFVQSIGRLTPQYWAQKGMTDVIGHGAHLGDIWSSLGVLLAFGAVGLFIASFRYTSFIRSANS